MYFTPLDRFIRDYLLNKDNKNPIFVSNGGLQKIVDNIIKELTHKVLPHGSGIDSLWSYERIEDLTFDFYNDYHVMDQNGFYCGYVCFTLTIDLLTKDFNVEASQRDIADIEEDYRVDCEKTAKRCDLDLDYSDDACPYLDDLEDYLHDTIASSLELYYASESINYLVTDSYYRELIKRTIEKVESNKINNTNA